MLGLHSQQKLSVRVEHQGAPRDSPFLGLTRGIIMVGHVWMPPQGGIQEREIFKPPKLASLSVEEQWLHLGKKSRKMLTNWMYEGMTD